MPNNNALRTVHIPDEDDVQVAWSLSETEVQVTLAALEYPVAGCRVTTTSDGAFQFSRPEGASKAA